LTGLLAETLEGLDSDRLVQRALDGRHPGGPLSVVAIGKAAPAMASGALAALGARVRRCLVVTRHGGAGPWMKRLAGADVIEAGHPLPDADSLRAGQALLDILADATGEWLFLLSGGASALVEVPRAGVGLDDLRRANRWLIGSGLDIGAINRVRCRLSRIKGGGLLAWLQGRPARVLLVSDVPGDDPALVGSGLLYPGAAARALPAGLPDWLRALCAGPVPDVAHGVVPHEIVANLELACEQMEQAGRRRGLKVHRHAPELDGEAADTGRELVRYLLQAPAGLHLWGGEPRVTLPAQPGRGGRCQQLALAAAVGMAGRDDLWLLAAGTDGSDGPGDDAGALVDGATLARGELAGLDAADCLRRADAGRFLEASGDLLSTGPTGSNVRDLVLALKPGAA